MKSCVAENIQNIIKNKGYKQGAIAERAGFSPQAFSAMLTGRKTLRVDYIPAIAKALCLEANDLFASNHDHAS